MALRISSPPEVWKGFRSWLGRLQFVWNLIHAKKWLWMLATVLVLIRTATQVVVPLLAANAVDSPGLSEAREQLAWPAMLLAGLAGVTGIMQLIYGYGATIQNLKITDRVTEILFSKLAKAPLDFVYSRPASYWQSRIQGDVKALQTLYPHVLIFQLSGFLTALFFTVIVFRIHWSLTVGLIIVAPAAAWFQLLLRRRVRRIKERRMEISAINTSWLTDVLNALPLVKLSCAEDREKEELDRRLKIALVQSVKIERLRILIGFLGKGVKMLAPLLLYGWAYLLVHFEVISMGDLLAFAIYSVLITRGVQSSARATTHIDDGLVALDRLSEILDVESEPGGEGSRPLAKQPIQVIEFKNVSFSYPIPRETERAQDRRDRLRKQRGQAVPPTQEKEPKKILDGVNLRLTAGSPAILVGHSGAGKSTLMKILCGFYRPDSGSILVDGVDLRELDVHEYRRNLSQVSHEGILLARDFTSNVAFRVGEDDRFATERERLTDLLRLGEVQSRERRIRNRRLRRISRDAEGSSSSDLEPPGELQVSAGEKQRIAVARELLHSATLWGLDEATSNLDGALEESVLDLVMARKGLVLLAVSHRLSCIRRFGTIHVMNEGRIAATGSHDSLLECSEDYRRLVTPQIDARSILGASTTQTLDSSSQSLPVEGSTV